MSDDVQGARWRAVVWRRLDMPGMEWCALRRGSESWLLQGRVVLVLNQRPTQVSYEVECADTWLTRRTRISLDSGDEARSLDLSADEEGHWTDVTHGHEVGGVRGCVDVDLGATPATNTLPILRLHLAVGESQEITTAWVRFPELTVQPLAQRYTRLDEQRYRYESVASGFTAELVVDELGLVVSYSEVWERVASA